MVPEDLVAFRRMYMGFTVSRVILTANNLGVFEHLKKSTTAPYVAGKVRSNARATEILLDALTGIGLLKKSGDGKYKNAPLASRYLVKGAPLYQGDIVRHSSNMWQGFSQLDEVVRKGKPVKRTRDHESFIMGMHNLTVLRAGTLINAIGLKGVRKALDLGGGPGTNAMAMAKKGVKATIFDLPESIPLAKRIARRERIKGLSYIAGDFHMDDIGTGYDLILLSQIFHAFSIKENRALLRKCRKALNPGGRVVIQEFPIHRSRTSPPHSAIFSVNMLVGTRSGRCYTVQEMKEWLSGTGFRSIRSKGLQETVIVEGKVLS